MKDDNLETLSGDEEQAKEIEFLGKKITVPAGLPEDVLKTIEQTAAEKEKQFNVEHTQRQQELRDGLKNLEALKAALELKAAEGGKKGDAAQKALDVLTFEELDNREQVNSYFEQNSTAVNLLLSRMEELNKEVKTLLSGREQDEASRKHQEAMSMLNALADEAVAQSGGKLDRQQFIDDVIASSKDPKHLQSLIVMARTGTIKKEPSATEGNLRPGMRPEQKSALKSEYAKHKKAGTLESLMQEDPDRALLLMDAAFD